MPGVADGSGVRVSHRRVIALPQEGGITEQGGNARVAQVRIVDPPSASTPDNHSMMISMKSCSSPEGLENDRQ
jgi:hypothetical protein